MDGKAAAAFHQVASLAELPVFGAENDGDVIDRRLERIVYAHAEAAADVGDFPVAIDGREQSEAVDDEARIIPQVLPPCGREAQGGALEHGFDGAQVLLVDFVRGDDEFQFGPGVEIGDKDFFVLRP